MFFLMTQECYEDKLLAADTYKSTNLASQFIKNELF